MNKKKILLLAAESYKGGYLDEKRVNLISSFLNRADLKKYIRVLIRLENTKKIEVFSAGNINHEQFEKLFPNKRISVKYDPSLLLGARIADNDMVYELTLKNSLDKIISNIEKNYD